MKKVLSISFIVVLLGTILFISGCCSSKSYPAAQQRPAPAPLEEPAPVIPKQAPASECGPYVVTRDYPSQNVVRLEKKMPMEVQLNASFDYSIEVTNLTDVMLADVIVTERLPENFKFTSADPEAKKDGNKLVWTIESLDPKASEQIRVVGMATNTDCLQHCATVTYVIPACANVKVVQAKLRMTKTAPTEVLICDSIPVEFVVTNSGSGSAQNVKVVDTLTAGLRTADGKSELVFNAGALAAGQSKKFSTSLKASKTGKYVNTAVASSDEGLKAEATTTTVVRQPVLRISKTGPKRQYLGRAVQYDITVTNEGDAPATKSVVEDTIPSGVTSITATDGGTVVGSKVVWELGTLAVRASKKVSISYTPTKADTLTNTATATAYCAETVKASIETSVAGIPAVLLEVIDLEDPVEVRGQTTYVITATNQGSMADTNIRIVCTWEDNQQYVSSSGVTTGSVEGNTVRFAPLANLAPKATATWRVVVRALKPGDVRFKVTMNTDQLQQRPVEETEATRIYE